MSGTTTRGSTPLGLELQGLYDCARLSRELGIEDKYARAYFKAHGADIIDGDDLLLLLEDNMEYLVNPIEERGVAATIYTARDKNGELLYVGITGKGIRRAHQHARSSKWWPLAASLDLEHFADRQLAEARERQLIRRLSPHFNVTYRTDEP